jgi:hypothetical protein
MTQTLYPHIEYNKKKKKNQKTMEAKPRFSQTVFWETQIRVYPCLGV